MANKMDVHQNGTFSLTHALLRCNIWWY